jgi:hypothetical protein
VRVIHEKGIITMNISSRYLAAIGLSLFSIPFSVNAVKSYAQVSAQAAGANFDGPAELPREYVKSSLKDSHAGGRSWTVKAGESIGKVLNQASCDDTVQLQAGAAFSEKFVIPAKPCDDAHWITIRTSAPDASLPSEGVRLTPCYAGIASLAGRPAYHCDSTANVLAKIEFDGKGGSGPILFSSGANHYRFIGLEITRAPSPATVYNLVQFDGPADHLIFDRCWFHGTPQDETARGIMLGVSRYVAVVDSFFTDFHCVAKTGACVDSQAIGGGLGDAPMGPYKIVNNFLEAAGETIMFGGGKSTVNPQDIEIRHNHMFKPLTWLKGQPGYVGGTNGSPFIVKNLLEFKNGQRVLVEGNLMENCWGGFTQIGFAILLTPKNPGNNFCPSCSVTDITIRYNLIHHVGSGMQIGNGLADNGGAARDGQRYSIHDIVIDDIDGAKFGGPSEFAQVSMGAGAATLQNVTINHVTAFPSSRMFVVGAPAGSSAPMKNFVFTNNIVNASPTPLLSTGGGAANCAFGNSPLKAYNACFSGSVFSANVMIAPPPSAQWPPKNFFPGSVGAVRFSRYDDGNGGDYHLQPSSPYKGAGTDGKDIGADISAITAATAGVE